MIKLKKTNEKALSDDIKKLALAVQRANVEMGGNGNGICCMNLVYSANKTLIYFELTSINNEYVKVT